MTPSADLLQRAIEAARGGRRTEARELLLRVVEADSRNELAWIWLTGLVDSIEDRIIACENVLTINPGNEKVRAYLNQLHQQEPNAEKLADTNGESGGIDRAAPAGARPSIPPANADLLDLARQYEAEGRLEDALKALGDKASRTTDSRTFDRIYREILRIEALQKESILHIRPASTILRMTFGWPLLYFFLALVQVGLNPVMHPTWYLWLGLPIVVVGGFLLALSEVRSRHPAWKIIFAEENEAGSGAARLTAAVGGWILVLLPHLLLLLDAWNRLQVFQIPTPPLTGGG